MKEIEVKELINLIQIKIHTDEWIGLSFITNNRYNKKAFFKINCVLFVGLFFIYDTEITNKEVDYKFNSIVSIDTKGNNISHDSFSNFMSYLSSMPEVTSVDMS